MSRIIGSYAVFALLVCLATAVSGGSENFSLQFQPPMNTSAVRFFFWHSTIGDDEAGIMYNEITVQITASESIFFASGKDALSIIEMEHTNETHVRTKVTQDTFQTYESREWYYSREIESDFDTLNFHAHGVDVLMILLQTKLENESEFINHGLWDFQNQSKHEDKATQGVIRISHDTSESRDAYRNTGLSPQWLSDNTKHYLRPNSYFSEGNLHWQDFHERNYGEEEKICKVYIHTVPKLEITLGCAIGEEFSSVTNACSACLHGKYNDGTTLTCQDCEEFKGTIEVGSSNCVFCPTGKYLDVFGDSSCISCESGKYRDTKSFENDRQKRESSLDYSESCTSCNAGKYNGDEGSTDESACIECDAGKFSVLEGAEAAASCTACETGKYSISGSKICLDCPSNHTTIAEQTSDGSCVCDVGFHQVGVLQCQGCSVGKYQSQTNQSACRDCESGTFQNETAQTMCHACAEDEFAAQGSSLCQKCPKNSFTINGIQTKQGDCKCKRGFGKGTPDGNCTICEAGKFSDSFSDNDCHPCLAGQYQPNVGQSSCLQCNQSQYSSNNSLSCHDCHQNSRRHSDTSTTLTGTNEDCKCNEGYFKNQSQEEVCMQCAKGKFKPNVSDAECTDCTAGKFSALVAQTKASQCQNCSEVSYSGAGSSSCYNCHSHAISVLPMARKENCLCKPGYTNISENCSLCDVGTYKIDVGNVACSECSVGKSSNAQGATSESTCVACGEGYYASKSSRVCSPCPLGATSLPPRREKNDCKCRAGYHGLDASECKECEAGTYKSAIGSSICIACESGKFSNRTAQTSIHTCEECLQGHYAPAKSIACISCPTNSDSWGGRAEVKDCLCNLGFHGSAEGLCLPCPAGSFKNRVGPQGCTACPAGTFSQLANASWASTCILCETGKYSAANSTSCASCTEHSTSVKGSSSSVNCLCSPGYQFNEIHSTCDQCDLGLFKAGLGNQGQCTPIPENSSPVSTNDGWLCNKGYEPQANKCVACARGTYKPAQGNVLCTHCTNQKTTRHTAQVLESACTEYTIIDLNGNGMIERSEMIELQTQIHMEFTRFTSNYNTSLATFYSYLRDVNLQLEGDFSKGEIFYYYQKAGGQQSQFTVDTNTVADYLSNENVEIDIAEYDRDGDEMISETEWLNIVGVLKLLENTAKSSVIEIPVTGDEDENGSSGSAAGQIAITASSIVAAVFIFYLLLRQYQSNLKSK